MNKERQIVNKAHNYNVISVLPHRANLVLQMLLQFNVYISVIWGCTHLLYILIKLDTLWNYNGLAVLLVYVLAVGAEWVRLYASYAINLSPGGNSMWLLLSLTPCVLLPSLVYLRIAGISNALLLHLTADTQFVLMALEVLVALIHYAFDTKKPMEGKQENMAKVYA